MNIRSKVTACCLFGSLLAGSTRADEASAIAEVEKLGGSVRVIAQNTSEKEVAFHLSGKDLTDDGLAQLKQIPDIVWLNLRGTQITDAGLQHLADLKSLTRLHLEQTAVTDAGLAHLSDLGKLEYLNLYGTQVTDAGLDHLKNLQQLKKLYVWQTQVSQAGVDKLKASLPDVDVNRGADAEPTLPTQTAVIELFDSSLSIVWSDKVADASDGSTAAFVAKPQ